MVDGEVEFFPPVVASDGAPPFRALAARSYFVSKARLRDKPNAPMTGQTPTEIGVLAIEKEPLVETLDRTDHETGAHDLGDRLPLARRAGSPISEATRKPIEMQLFEQDGEQGQLARDALLIRPIGIQQPPSRRHDLRAPFKNLGKPANRPWFRVAIAIQKEHEIAGRDRHPLVIGRSEPAVLRIRDQTSRRELRAHHLRRAIGGRVVDHDDLVLRLDLRQAPTQLVARVEADDDDADV